MVMKLSSLTWFMALCINLVSSKISTQSYSWKPFG